LFKALVKAESLSSGCLAKLVGLFKVADFEGDSLDDFGGELVLESSRLTIVDLVGGRVVLRVRIKLT
jgi:hypothetical protein